MKINFRLIFALLAVPALSGNCTNLLYAAGEDGGMSVSIRPARFIDVTGDVEKFRAHTWMADGYTGGINALSLQDEFSNGGTVSFNVHAIPNENDQKVDLLLTREDFGVLDVQYKTFKKFYDHSGGYFYPFGTSFETSEGEENLDMDIGSFLFDLSPAFGSDYGLNFTYEHHSKDGRKSRLSWAEVSQNGFEREIAPSWQDIKETVDTVSIKGDTDIGGFNVQGEHSFEIYKENSVRTEKFLSDVSGSGTKIRNQYQEPEAISLTTVLKGDKWFNDDKTFMSLAYRFSQINNKESENIVETDESGAPTNAYSSPKNFLDSSASNKLNSHAWVGHYFNTFSKDFNFSVKSKANVVTADSDSIYVADTNGAAPDGISSDLDIQDTKNKALRLGESLGFQYTGISKAAIYGEVEFGYDQSELSEIQIDDSGAVTWFRNTDTNTQKWTWVLGSRYVPTKVFNITSHIRRNQELNDYDDQSETSGINSAFFEELSVVTNEATTKMTWKPVQWLQNSIRYQFLHKKFDARAESLVGQEAVTESHIVTLDTSYQPTDSLFLNLSLSQQNITTKTAAAADTSVNRAPEFDGDVTSALFSASYAPSEELSLFSSMNYSFSDNFQDFTLSALPLAVTNNRFNTEVGLRWAPKNKAWVVEPKYAYYDYNTHSESESGDYRAHAGWVDVSFDW